MRKWRKGLAAIAISASIAIGSLVTPFTAMAAQVRATDVTSASSGKTFITVEGTFLKENVQNLLDTINQYRKEACDNGYPDPRNSSQKLTSADYVPIQWSGDLEEIAQTRAGEASLLTDHMRPNGTYCISCKSTFGVTTKLENIAWNWPGSETAQRAISQWYAEKNEYVKGGHGETGHYTSMINPNIKRIGIGVFGQVAVAEFSDQYLANWENGVSGTREQVVEVPISSLAIACNNSLTVSVNGSQKITTMLVYYSSNCLGQSGYVQVKPNGATFGFSSNDPGIATVDADGNVKGIKAGSTTISIFCNGITATCPVTVQAGTSSQGTQTQPSTGRPGTQTQPIVGRPGTQTQPSTGGTGIQTQPAAVGSGTKTQPSTGKTTITTTPSQEKTVTTQPGRTQNAQSGTFQSGQPQKPQVTTQPNQSQKPQVTTQPNQPQKVTRLMNDPADNEKTVQPNGRVQVVKDGDTIYADDANTTGVYTITNSAFSDVPANSFYVEAVGWAVKNNITQGTGNGKFAPNRPCTRGQMVEFLYRLSGSPDVPGTVLFSDVPNDAYYRSALVWAQQNGITTGTSFGAFSPNKPCSRGEMAAFLYRLKGKTAVSGTASFTDVDAGSFYADAVNWLKESGITSGKTATEYKPNDTCSRGEMVTFLYRYAGNE